MNERPYQKTVTQEGLVQGFLKLGILPGDTLEVHSSLSSMGYVEEGAQTVIRALIETVGPKGTILMSAYPVSKIIPLTAEDRRMGIRWKVKILDDSSNQKTGMGAIVDEFVKREDTMIGQGSHRVCAWGKDKAKYMDGFAPIYKANGKVLLIGVGVDRCSSLHLAEDVPLPSKIEGRFTLSREILEKYPPSEWSIGGKEPPGDAWSKVFEWASKQGHVKKTKIGKGECFLFRIKPLIDEYRRLRKDDPYGLLEVENE